MWRDFSDVEIGVMIILIALGTSGILLMVAIALD
jgi:hypothetical protein